MATRTFGRMHGWICMILLLAVAAALLPAHSTSAEEQKVLIPKQQLDLSIWSAHSDLLLSRAQRIEAVIRTELMNVSRRNLMPLYIWIRTDISKGSPRMRLPRPMTPT